MVGKLLAEGNFQGSAPLAIYPSLNKITGVICCRAIRTASNAISKQSLGVEVAIIGIGASPFLP